MGTAHLVRSLAHQNSHQPPGTGGARLVDRAHEDVGLLPQATLPTTLFGLELATQHPRELGRIPASDHLQVPFNAQGESPIRPGRSPRRRKLRAGRSIRPQTKVPHAHCYVLLQHIAQHGGDIRRALGASVTSSGGQNCDSQQMRASGAHRFRGQSAGTLRPAKRAANHEKAGQ